MPRIICRLGAQNLRHNPVIDQAWNHLRTAKSIGGESLDWRASSAGMRVTACRSPLLGESASRDQWWCEWPYFPTVFCAWRVKNSEQNSSASSIPPAANLYVQFHLK